MSRRSPLMGFTEAELGFIVAAVIAFAATAPTTPSEQLTSPVTQDTRVADTASRGSKTPVTDSTRGAIRPGKRDELPYCSQLGLADSPLGIISILDTASYLVGSDTLSRLDLETRLSHAVAQSDGRQCKFRLFFRVVGDLPYRWVRKAKAPFFSRFVVSDRD